MLTGSAIAESSTKEAPMKRATGAPSKRKPKTRVINDAPRAEEVADAARVTSRRKPPRAA